MSVMIYWFRQDARLHDAPVLRWAAERASALCRWCVCRRRARPAGACCVWGRTDRRRAGNLAGLDASFARAWVAGWRCCTASRRRRCQPWPVSWALTPWCERIAAPEEDAEVAALRARLA